MGLKSIRKLYTANIHWDIRNIIIMTQKMHLPVLLVTSIHQTNITRKQKRLMRTFNLNHFSSKWTIFFFSLLGSLIAVLIIINYSSIKKSEVKVILRNSTDSAITNITLLKDSVQYETFEKLDPNNQFEVIISSKSKCFIDMEASTLKGTEPLPIATIDQNSYGVILITFVGDVGHVDITNKTSF